MHLRVLALLGGLSLIAAGCGGSSANGDTTTGQSSHVADALSFARCMRSHGVPHFPDPRPDGSFPPFSTGVSKQISSAANDTCKQRIRSGVTATPQQRQTKLAFGVKVAECMRTHGYPTLPDPTALGSNALPAGIDANSPRFQSTETDCENQASKALGLP
jgi:hypothetical protein